MWPFSRNNEDSKDEEKRTRGKSLTGKERMQRLEAKWLSGLEKKNPAKFDRIMSQRHGLEEERRDPIGDAVSTIRRLKDEGLIDDSNKVGEKGIGVKDILEGLAGLSYVVPMFTGKPLMGAAGDGAPPVHRQAALPGMDPEPEPQQMPENVVQMSQTSGTIINMIKEAQPGEVADMFITAGKFFPKKDVRMACKEIVEGFCQTPNEQLNEFLQGILGKYPDLQGLFAWLSQRPEYFRDCIIAIREKMGAEPNQPQKRASGL